MGNYSCFLILFTLSAVAWVNPINDPPPPSIIMQDDGYLAFELISQGGEIRRPFISVFLLRVRWPARSPSLVPSPFFFLTSVQVLLWR